MDTDQSILQTFTTQLNRLWQVPLTFALALLMIIRQLGWAGAIGVMCMIMLGPSTRIVIAYLRKYLVVCLCLCFFVSLSLSLSKTSSSTQWFSRAH
jgi:hypothetical protein